mgnify:FL=1
MNKIHTLQLEALPPYEFSFYLADSPETQAARVFPCHVHDTLEVYLLLEGDISFSVERNVYRLLPGDVILSRPNEMHNCIQNSPSPHRHMCFWFTPTSPFLFGDLTEHRFGEGNCLSLAAGELDRIYKTAKELTATEDRMRLYLFSLSLLDALRRNPRLREGSRVELPPVLRDILSDMDAHYTENIRLDVFAARHFISPSTMGRLFAAYLHTTPRAYLETKRLAYSRVLLRNGARVSDAGEAAGFPDDSAFIRLFRRRFGMTPHHYKTAPPVEFSRLRYEDKEESPT